MAGQHLADALTLTRLSLHVLAAAIWVGGQLTVGGLLPTLRRLGDDAGKKVARAFGRLEWPAYVVLLGTGAWNIVASHPATATASWRVILWVKIAVVVAAGLAAFFHQKARTKAGLAIGGAVAGVTSVAALVLGVALAG